MDWSLLLKNILACIIVPFGIVVAWRLVVVLPLRIIVVAVCGIYSLIARILPFMPSLDEIDFEEPHSHSGRSGWSDGGKSWDTRNKELADHCRWQHMQDQINRR